MTTERMSPLRRRMIEDMMVRGHGEKTKLDYIRAIRRFAAFLGRPPDTATAEDLRAYQLHMTETNVSVTSFNQAIHRAAVLLHRDLRARRACPPHALPPRAAASACDAEP